MAGRPWVGAIRIVKMKDWNWEMKKCEKEMEGERARPWLGRRVIQMKLEAYETYFFFRYPNAQLLATSYNGPSEWDRTSMKGRETAKPHERRLRLHLSFEFCNFQSSKSSSLESLTCFFGPLSGFICAILFWQKKDYTVSWMQIPLFVILFLRNWCLGHSSSP